MLIAINNFIKDQEGWIELDVKDFDMKTIQDMLQKKFNRLLIKQQYNNPFNAD